jgi:hydrogenase expression/formation protein HypD
VTGRVIDTAESLDRLNDAARQLGRTVRFMEVCGTHTVNAFRSGLHSLMPPNVTLLSGPGCPVCVTSQGDIDQLIELSLQPDVTLCTYGDMVRVTGASGSLEEARGRGADVRIVYSALDAVQLARENPSQQVIFAAVGFETTAPATAAAVLEAERLALTNFTAFTSHKLIIPAMRALLQAGVNIDGFVCPGHVAVIIGAMHFARLSRNMV